MVEVDSIYIEKALESLAGAASEHSNRRYNNCANRCYYATFQAAVYALEQAGVTPASRSGAWSHQATQAEFAGQLIQRRKVYPGELRSVLSLNESLRESADYEPNWVTETQAERALRRTRGFVEAVYTRGGGRR